jgi:hypothetical protein
MKISFQNENILMNNKIEMKYSADKTRKSYGGTKNKDLYLFRQAQ